MSTFTDAERDAQDLAKLVNEDTTVETRYGGQPKKSWQYLQNEFSTEFAETLLEINKSRGFRVVGTFADGFSYELFNDVGIDSSGNSWVYVGAGAPVKTVTAGTVPSTPDYQQITFNSSVNIQNNDGTTAQDTYNLAVATNRLAISQSNRYQYEQKGKLMDSTDTAAPARNWSSSWTHATCAYDSSDGKFIIFYNISNGHNIAQNQVLMATKSPEGDIVTRSVVASNVGVESLKCQAAGITLNGDYVALVGVFNWNSTTSIRTDIYRSTDRGASWSISTMRDSADNSDIVAYNGDVTGFLVLSNGRILTFADEPSPSYAVRIYYSDDNGVTWSKSTVAGNPTDVTEPAWIELPSGTIVCMARAAVRLGSSNQKIPAKLMYSYDGGVNWTEPVDSQSITEMTLANGQMFIDEKNNLVEFIYHSRFAQQDGFSSIYASRANFEDAANDNWSTPVRIGKLASYANVGTSSGDSGYIGGGVTPEGVVNLFYYTGLRSSAQINWIIGRREHKPATHYPFDLFSGEKVLNTKKSVLFNGSGSSLDFINTMIAGVSESTTEYNQTPTHIELSLPAFGAVGAKFLYGVDLTGIDRMYVRCNCALADGASVGLFLYEDYTPASSTTGRIKFNESNSQGFVIFDLDVSGINEIVYPQVVLRNLSGTPSPSTVEILEIGIDCVDLSFRPPSVESPLCKLYERGNTYDLTSNGWSEGYADPTASVTFLSDHALIAVDGSSNQTRGALASGLVDLTNFNFIEAIVDVNITDITRSDTGLAIYSSLPPALNPISGRVSFNYDKKTGLCRKIIDVSSLNGNYHVMYFCNANTSTTDPSIINANILSVKAY